MFFKMTPHRMERGPGLFTTAIVLLFFLLLTALPVRAQTLTTAHREATLYAGPGHTYYPTGKLNPGVAVEIVERNHTGNWLRVQRTTSDGTVAQDGWVMSGYLRLDYDVFFSEIPVTDLPDGDPSTVNSRSQAELYAVPVIPTINEAMIDVFQRGQSSGKRADVVTKVGDSLSASDLYLDLFARDDYELGPYDYLEDTLLHYGPSLDGGSIAAEIGLSSLVVFDPMWARDDRCQPGETPLACEYRVKQPAIALIMFGPNDVRSMDTDTYRENMRRVVGESLDTGVIPVLFTFSNDPDAELFWQGINFNRALVEIADEYGVPLVNLWAAAQALPDHGLDVDRVHLKFSGFRNLKFDTGHESWYGVSLQNLLALRILDALRRTLNPEIETNNP